MDPQTPQQRRALESPLLSDPAPPGDRGPGSERRRSTGRALLAAVLLIAAIVVLIILL